MALLIRNASVVATMDESQGDLFDQDILIDGPLIAAVGQTLRVHGVEEVIDGRGKLVLPGFINTHHHMFQIFTRDVSQHLAATDLYDWLRKMYRVWHAIDSEMVYVSAMVALGLLAKTGCTLVSDNHYLFPDIADRNLIDMQIQAAKEIGIRFHPTRGSVSPSDVPRPLAPRNVTQSDDEILEDYDRLVARYHDPSDFSMVRIGLGPTNPVTSSETIMRETVKFARKHGLFCHTHLSESPKEEEWCVQTHGMRLLDYAETLGWVGPDIWFAHCLGLTDDEISRMGSYDCGVATNPVCNARSHGSIAAIFKMVDAGVRVGMGVDGSGGYGDMIAEIQSAALLHTYQGQKTGSMPREKRVEIARRMLAIATKGGASVLGWDKLGMIKPGYAADLILFDTTQLEFSGILTDPVASLVLYGVNHFTDTTIANGRVIVRKGKLLNVDEGKLVERANHLERNLLSRLQPSS